MRIRWTRTTMVFLIAATLCAARPRNAAEWWAQRPLTIHEARRAQGRTSPWSTTGPFDDTAPTPAREAVGITKPNKMGLASAAPVGEKSE